MSKSIAIDGPAGAGKSTIAKRVAAELGFIYLDTGAMYRAVALKAIKSGFDTKSQKVLAEMVENIDITICHQDDKQRIYLDGKDVTEEIRTPDISAGASNVAVFREVRLKMVDLQRNIAAGKNVVMDGRDIGSYVLPDADLKIFLTAAVEERARRRYDEMLEKGQKAVQEEVKQDMIFRDNNDSSRAFAPLVKAGDAIELDSTNMTIDQVVHRILDLFEECGRSKWK